MKGPLACLTNEEVPWPDCARPSVRFFFCGACALKEPEFCRLAIKLDKSSEVCSIVSREAGRSLLGSGSTASGASESSGKVIGGSSFSFPSTASWES